MRRYGVHFPKYVRRKPRWLLEYLYRTGKKEAKKIGRFNTYKPCDVLMLYGWGGKEQQERIKQHGKTYVAWDLGYWNRDGLTHRQWRVSINGFHSPNLIMRGPEPKGERWTFGRQQFVEKRREGGSEILLLGNAPKSQQAIGQGWADKMLKRLRAEFPGERIVYRQKPNRLAEPTARHCDAVSDEPIEAALQRARLVVTRHSNVAVDACMMGVPVACEDGAAAAIYPRIDNWRDQPNAELRLAFLKRLAYWQWSIHEIQQGKMWPWLEEQLDSLP